MGGWLGAEAGEGTRRRVPQYPHTLAVSGTIFWQLGHCMAFSRRSEDGWKFQNRNRTGYVNSSSQALCRFHKCTSGHLSNSHRANWNLRHDRSVRQGRPTHRRILRWFRVEKQIGCCRLATHSRLRKQSMAGWSWHSRTGVGSSSRGVPSSLRSDNFVWMHHRSLRNTPTIVYRPISVFPSRARHREFSSRKSTVNRQTNRGRRSSSSKSRIAGIYLH